MTAPMSGRRGGLRAAAATAALLLTGCAGTAPDDGGGAGAPPAPSAASTPASPVPDRDGPPATAAPAAAEPAALRIPALGTDSPLLHLGLRADGSLEVPPEDPGAPASWYDGSPAPGEQGPAVLLGHVNATGGGPGVFAGLRRLVPGDRVEVGREDGSTAVFTVDRGAQYGKDGFPTLEVYGNTAGAELRLITCDGYDPATGQFDDNYVVYASLER
ncbi:class F sortase [Kocuria flava]|uniref:class F sortase n=1 Tax=Kocuria flava TaxID=446860 RepID=UPI002F92FF10